MVFSVNHKSTVKTSLLYLSTKNYAASFRHQEFGWLQQILWFCVKNATVTFKTETLSKTSHTMTSCRCTMGKGNLVGICKWFWPNIT